MIVSIASFLISFRYAQTLVSPPPIPSQWPSVNQNIFISDSFLEDPLVSEALKYVQLIVPASILAITPSKYIAGSKVGYSANPFTNCYWPSNGCTRNTNSDSFKADIINCPNANDWGISFDDGPTVSPSGNDTNGIRNALIHAGVNATFFIVGSNAIVYPAQVPITFKAGFHIASHSWTHHPMTSLTNAQIVAEVRYTEAIIYQSSGVVVKYFRPPYGDVDDRVRAIVSALGYRLVLWSKDSGDSLSSATTASVTKNVDGWEITQPGFISLEHDISSLTSGAAITILKTIKNGMPLNIKSIAECMGDGYPYVHTVDPDSIASLNATAKAVDLIILDNGSTGTLLQPAPTEVNKQSGVKVAYSITSLLITVLLQFI